MHDQRFDSPVSALWLLTLLFATCLLAAPAKAQEAAARVLHVAGQVHASSSADGKRRLRRGDEVFPGDTLESSRASSAQLVFSDNGRMAVRANTVVRVVDYRYDADDVEKSNSFITLLGGAVRTITGLIGQFNKNKVLLTTPMATIGIRGTDHETIYIQPGPAIAEDSAHAGTYNIVYSGATVLRSPGGELLLDSNDIGFVADAADRTGAPVLIDSLPRSVEDMLALNIPQRVRIADLHEEDTDRVRSIAATQGVDAPAFGKNPGFGMPRGNAGAAGVASSSFGISTATDSKGQIAGGLRGSQVSSGKLPPGGGLIKPPKPPKPPKLPGSPRVNSGNR